MRKLLGGLFLSGLVVGAASAQDESFRFFFDTAGAAEEAPFAGSLSFTNPTIAGSGTLYLWVQYGTANQEFHGINLIVDITGDAQITGATMYDHDVPAAGVDRWQVVPNPNWGGLPPPDDSSTRWTTGSVFKVGGAAYGAKNVASNGHPHPSTADTHFTTQGQAQFGATLLAAIQVTSTGPTTGEVRLQNGTSGNGGVTFTPSDFVYFGFGDAAVPNKKGGLNGGPGGPTPIADAFVVVPEPASLALLGLGALVLRRRR